MKSSIQQELSEKLENNNSISYKEIYEIVEAFQIASGQGFASGKTKALLDYLIGGKSLIIENFDYSNKSKIVTSTKELIDIYKHIDQYVDLSQDKEFEKYFD